MKTVQQLLTRATKWCQNTYARTRTGAQCDPHDPRAVRFCIRGACRKVYGEGKGYYDACVKLNAALPDQGISYFNDNSTFAEVKALLKKANV